MQYNLKNKITITNEFLNDLISKSWQELETIQQQIDIIDTGNQLGANVVKLLKNTCTSYYTLIGCLEALVEEPGAIEMSTAVINKADIQEEKQEPVDEPVAEAFEKKPCIALKDTQTETTQNFEPFEYFVDFDEPSGKPVTDEDLYN